MKLIPAEYDLTKLNKNKKIFQEEGIINKGFVIKMLPKIKSYYRYTTELIEKIKYSCREEKKNLETYDEIVNELSLASKNIPQ
jgi:hypothetical protein